MRRRNIGMQKRDSFSSVFWVCGMVMLILIVAFALNSAIGIAQAPTKQQPIDLMLLIDDSCSMFPESAIPKDLCTWFGSDPDFLRTTGAHLFIARLGFAEEDQENYQVGVMSFGEASPQVFELRPMSASARNDLAKEISEPTPQTETQIVPALERAYQELEASPERRPGNLPAIVMLTDGRPYPAAGQSEADIERLVAAHPNVPLFVMLLKSATNPDVGFDRYIDFWEGIQNRYEHVKTYRVNDATQIEKTYNEIVARLQNSNPSPRYTLKAGEPLRVFVGEYVQRIVLTIIHERGTAKGNVEIIDPLNNPVEYGVSDVVQRFRGEDNEVEVISIGKERLDQAPRDDVWTVTSDAPVSVFLDYLGAYDIDIVTPATSFTSLTNQLLAIDRHSPTQPFTTRFKLVDFAGNTVMERQPITGRVFHPDGTSAELRIPSDLTPDAEGLYEITHDFVSTYPGVVDELGRFMLALQAGVANSETGTRIPIARKDLLVDVGSGAYIADVVLDPPACKIGEPVTVKVTVGDLDTTASSDVRVKVIGLGQEIDLVPGGGDTYVGSLDTLCQAMLSNASCGQTVNESVRARLVVAPVDGISAPPSERPLPIQAIAPDCTPTPTPSPTATPTPTPTPTPPPPNQDGDRLPDVQDECATQAEWESVPYWDGCPPPWWVFLIAGLLLLAILAFLGGYLIPKLWVSFVSPPPQGYVLICMAGKPQGAVRSIRGAGLAARRSTVTIGSKGHIPVTGMSKVLRIQRQNKEAVVFDGVNKQSIRSVPSEIRDGEVVVKFCTDQSRLRC